MNITLFPRRDFSCVNVGNGIVLLILCHSTVEVETSNSLSFYSHPTVYLLVSVVVI